MIYDKNQLVRVISLTDAKLRKENICKCCGIIFQKGEICFSAGIRDDWNNCWERWYFCKSCSEVFHISAGTPRYLQEWALDNKLTLETWE